MFAALDNIELAALPSTGSTWLIMTAVRLAQVSCAGLFLTGLASALSIAAPSASTFLARSPLKLLASSYCSRPRFPAFSLDRRIKSASAGQ